MRVASLVMADGTIRKVRAMVGYDQGLVTIYADEGNAVEYVSPAAWVRMILDDGAIADAWAAQ